MEKGIALRSWRREREIVVCRNDFRAALYDKIGKQVFREKGILEEEGAVEGYKR
jgi:hypothetical protein